MVLAWKTDGLREGQTQATGTQKAVPLLVLYSGATNLSPSFLPLLIIADLIFKSVRMIFDYQVYECELLMTNEIWYNVNRKD